MAKRAKKAVQAHKPQEHTLKYDARDEKLTMLRFTTKDCAYCKLMEPEVEKFKAAHPELRYADVDGSDCKAENIFTKYRIQSVPTLAFVDSRGALVMRLIGSCKCPEIEATLVAVKVALSIKRKTEAKDKSKKG